MLRLVVAVGRPQRSRPVCMLNVYESAWLTMVDLASRDAIAARDHAALVSPRLRHRLRVVRVDLRDAGGALVWRNELFGARIMFSYFALTAVPQYRASVSVLKVAPIITGLQISQFAWGTVINAIAAVAYAQPDVGCAIQPAILYLAAGLYLAYGALFVHLFVRRYVRKDKKRADAVQASEDASGTSHGHHGGKNGVGGGLKAV